MNEPIVRQLCREGTEKQTKICENEFHLGKGVPPDFNFFSFFLFCAAGLQP